MNLFRLECWTPVDRFWYAFVCSSHGYSDARLAFELRSEKRDNSDEVAVYSCMCGILKRGTRSCISFDSGVGSPWTALDVHLFGAITKCA